MAGICNRKEIGRKERSFPGHLGSSYIYRDGAVVQVGVEKQGYGGRYISASFLVKPTIKKK